MLTLHALGSQFCSTHLYQGKTLQVISLIIADPPAGTDYAARVRAVEENKRQLEKLKREKEAAARGETLPGAVRVSVVTALIQPDIIGRSMSPVISRVWYAPDSECRR